MNYQLNSAMFNDKTFIQKSKNGMTLRESPMLKSCIMFIFQKTNVFYNKFLSIQNVNTGNPL